MYVADLAGPMGGTERLKPTGLPRFPHELKVQVSHTLRPRRANIGLNGARANSGYFSF